MKCSGFTYLVLQPDNACEMMKLYPGLWVQYQFKNIHAEHIYIHLSMYIP